MLMQATLRAVRIVGQAARDGEHAAFHCLDAGQLLGLDRRNQSLVVSEGRAWIAFGGQDFVVNEGERLHLGVGRDRALISSLGGRPLCLEVG